MINFKNSKKDTPSKSVSVTDNHLVLSLTHTENPVIWRMALDEIGTAVFSIKKGKNKSELILKQKKGSEEIIASFDQEQEALEVLSDISKKLINPQEKNKSGKSNASNQNSQTETDKKTEAAKWGIALILVFIIIGLYWYLTSLIPQQVSDINQATASGTETSSPQTTTGAPVSADEYLKGL